MIPTNIPLTLRIPKASPLTPEEVDANFSRLRDAITGLAEEFGSSRLVIGDEPPAGERSGVLWIPSDFRGIYVWNAATSAWVLLTPKEVIYVDDSGSGANFIIQVPEGISSYADLDGRLIVMKVMHNSTGASKLKIKNSSGTLFDNDGLNLVNHYLGSIELNDFKVGQKVQLVYNAGQFQMLTAPAPVKLADFRNVFTYQSNLAGIPASGGVLTFTHGLKYSGNDVAPAIVRVVFKRKNTDFTHTSTFIIKIGDEIDSAALWTSTRGSENEMFWPVIRTISSATEIRVQFYYPCGIALPWNWLGKNGNTFSVDKGWIGNTTDYEVRVYAMAYNPDQLGSISGSSTSGGANAPVVTLQPANQTAASGASVSFTAAGSYGTSISWFVAGQQVNGTRFTDIDSVSGNNISSTLTISGLTASDNNALVYAVIQGPGGVVQTSTVTLTVT